MIPAVVFVAAFLLMLAVGYGLLRWRMERGWSRKQPSAVGDRLRTGNRILLGVLLVVLLLLAVLEIFVPTVSYYVVESQYWVGDRLVQELTFHNGVGAGTISWGLYLALFLGLLLGNMMGQSLAMRRYPILRGLTFRSLLARP